MENILATLNALLDTAPNIQSARLQIKSALRLNRLNLLETQNDLFKLKCDIQKATRLLSTGDLDPEDTLFWRHTKDSSELSIKLLEEQIDELTLSEKTLTELNSKCECLCINLDNDSTHKQIENFLEEKLQSLLPKQVQVKDGN